MRIALTQGAYQARSIIANAQRCLNLYPENNPKDSPVPVTHYPTPGTTLLVTAPNIIWRGLYRASNGELYGVVGRSLYFINEDDDLTFLGAIDTENTPVSMADNGFTLVLVDGSPSGYKVNMASKVFQLISSPNFYGADKVDYLDTFFIFNRPDTTDFYTSLSLSVDFDPLDIASKTGYPDHIVTLIVMHKEIWLLGSLTTEIWCNAGGELFPFERMPGTFVEHGCVAKYSVAKQDLSIYWLSQDMQGHAIVLRGTSYTALRISTHAIENAISGYARIDDAIGYTYQQEGHTFYVLTFPTANKTWAYDQATELWHERAWTDSDGNLERHRSNCCAAAYGKIYVGDWQNGKLYDMSLDVYQDESNPISRIRSFPHLLNDGRRVSYQTFIADMAVGNNADTTPSAPPQVSLRWSDTKGASWGNAITQSLGAGGEYLTSVQFQRLGLARDRVFELSWSMNAKTALNGAFVQAIAMAS